MRRVGGGKIRSFPLSTNTGHQYKYYTNMNFCVKSYTFMNNYLYSLDSKYKLSHMISYDII